jgi:hypothetical protein
MNLQEKLNKSINKTFQKSIFQRPIIRDNTRMMNLFLREEYITIKYLGTTIFNMDEKDIGGILWNFTTDS